MTSYYQHIKGTLEPGQLAKSGDINLIQDSVSHMIKNVIIDNFGTGYILGNDENSLTLSPTVDKIDQLNELSNEEDESISFYHQYLKQAIDIKKSEIHKIKCYLKNISDVDVIVWGELRDFKNEVISETYINLPSTFEDTFQEVYFNFNIEHLPIGRYYFCIRSLNISNAQVINGISTESLDKTMFVAKYDKDGRYVQGLSTSINGVDFTDSSLEVDLINGEVEYVLNSDLCFAEYYAREEGYTYNISPGAAIVLGEKTLPVDTHVTIDRSSGLGDRTDLVILKPDGRLDIIQGEVYQGEKVYPHSNNGLNIAYITTYRYSGTWECSYCHEINDDLDAVCPHCMQTTNPKTPLVEQEDNNGLTRTRDTLERLRRLENKVDYISTRNAPTRIKYNCAINPATTDDPDLKRSQGMEKTIDNNGNIVIRPTSEMITTQCYYTLKDANHLQTASSAILNDNIEYYEFEGQKIRMTTNITTSDTKTLNEIITQNLENYTQKDERNIVFKGSNNIQLPYTTAKDGYEYSISIYEDENNIKTPIKNKEIYFNVQLTGNGNTTTKSYTTKSNNQGVASFTFKFSEPGTYQVTTTCEGSSAQLIANIVVLNANGTMYTGTKLQTKNSTYSIEKGGYFTATLTDKSGKKLGNKNINFTLMNKNNNTSTTYPILTASNGQAKLKVSSKSKATYTVTTSFMGDSLYAPCTNEATIVFDKEANLKKKAEKTTTNTTKLSKIKKIVDKYFTKVNNSKAKKQLIVNAFAKCTTYNCVHQVVHIHGSGIPGVHNSRELALIKEVYQVVKK